MDVLSDSELVISSSFGSGVSEAALFSYQRSIGMLSGSDGATEFLDNVDRLKRLTDLVTEFVTELDAELHSEELQSLPADEQRCPKCSQHGRQCIRKRGHAEKHCRFTPSGSMSPPGCPSPLPTILAGATRTARLS